MAVDINGDGLIALGGTSTTQGRVRLAEDTDNGTNYVELTAPALLASNVTVTMPNADGTLINTDPGTASNVLTSNGTAWVSQAISAGGDYIMVAYTSPATWTKPAGLKAVKVTVIGAGGNGGTGGTAPPCPSPRATQGGSGGGGGAAVLYLDAPAISPTPGSVTVTVGSAPSKTSSFGPLVSATGGTDGSAGGAANAPPGPYAGGSGSGGTINLTGMAGSGSSTGTANFSGSSALGFGQGINNRADSPPSPLASIPGIAGIAYGGGALGGRGPGTGASGAAGIVIVEEFY